MYVILIDGAGQVFALNDDSNSSGNVILYILCVTFLFKAEGIVKSIFQVKSSAGTLADLATGGAAALAFGKQAISGVKGLMSNPKSKQEQEDEKDEKLLSDKNRQLEYDNKTMKKSDEQLADADNSAPTPGGPTPPPGGPTPPPGGPTPPPGGPTPPPGGPTPPPGGPTPPPSPAPGPAPAEPDDEDDKLNKEIMKAQIVLGSQGMRSRLGKAPRKANGFRKAANVVGKTFKGVAGFTAKGIGFGTGVAFGIASGDLTQALSSGLALGKAADAVVKGTGSGVTWAGRKFKAVNSKHGGKKSQEKMMKELKDAGVDTDLLFNSQKGELIKKALENYRAGMITGGKANADTKFNATIINESRRRRWSLINN